MGMGQMGMRHLHLPPVPGDQRLVAVHHGIHGRAIHRHLSPHEGPVHLHGAEGQEDHLRGLDLRLHLLQSVAVPHQDIPYLLQRVREHGDVHVLAVEEPVLGVLHGGPGPLLHSATDPVLYPVWPDCEDPVHE